MAGKEALRPAEAFPRSASSYYLPGPERREKSDRHQVLMREAVRALCPQQVGQLPCAAGEVNHRGGRSTGVHGLIEDTDRVALLSPKITLSPDWGQLDFIPRPLMRLGREDSRRQVFFGEMQGIRYPCNPEVSVEVAVSAVPAEEDYINHERSLHEIAMYQYLAKMGIPTLDVLGFVRSHEPDVYGFVITRYEPDIRTLDTLDWTMMSERDAAGALSHAVDMLALLHTNYVFHGDAEFKNIAVRDTDQHPTVVDLELSGSLSAEADDITKLFRYMSSDFSFIAASLDRSASHLYENEGMTSPTDRFHFMYEYLFLPYFNRLVQLGVTPGDPIGLAFDAVVTRRLDMAVQDVDGCEING
jgi:tRNA A-37 threonylcarbamoyl transferase component Bud32